MDTQERLEVIKATWRAKAGSFAFAPDGRKPKPVESKSKAGWRWQPLDTKIADHLGYLRRGKAREVETFKEHERHTPHPLTKIAQQLPKKLPKLLAAASVLTSPGSVSFPRPKP